MDVRRGIRVGCRVVPAIAFVFGEVLESGFQFADQPFGVCFGKEAHHVDHVRAVAEHHGARAKLVADDGSQAAHFAGSDHFPCLEITRIPAARVFN